ncbi:MAG: pyridoxamine 5'-phosphate oxidase, partial [Porticoccaceae bacterium]|nr:pyridoxamine 5'-phosphate oxidase [Porticoccaceae bacterium]
DSSIKDPTAMTVSTIDANGRPWHRAVLLKGFDERGFVFYTNLGSHKAQDMASNPQASLHFPWFFLDRQVCVSGSVTQVTRQEVETYFASRPRDSQIAAWASDQSKPIASRTELEAVFAEYKTKFGDQDIPAPDFWGGFRVKPLEFQFWQGGASRLHDRFQYLLRDDADDDKNAWLVSRLAP